MYISESLKISACTSVTVTITVTVAH